MTGYFRIVCAGLVLACSPDAAIDDIVDASEETTPPGWPLEIGDTTTSVALHDLILRFRPMSWDDADDVALDPDRYEERIRQSKYGIATFKSTLVEIPRDYKHKHSVMYACPPPGFVLYPDSEVWTTDGAIITDDLPTDSPCDPDKRFVVGWIYVGQVR